MSRPAHELEVKARITDVTALRRALRQAGARLEFRGTMQDRRFDLNGALASRDEVLRMRVYRSAGGGPPHGILAWKGAASTRGAYQHRAEIETEAPDPARLVAILERLGMRTVLRIDRRIEIWRLGKATLRLERFPRMDVLLEVEGSPAAIERALRATGLPRDRFLSLSLPYFQSEYERRTGRRAVIARKGK